MNDLRKAVDMPLEVLLDPKTRADEVAEAVKVIRQALAQPKQESLGGEWVPCVKLPVIVHVRNQRKGETHISTREGITPVLPEDLIMRGVAGEEYPIGRELFERTYTFDVDAVNMSQERVDETAKSEHEPWPSVQCVCGGTIYFKYTPPVSDYHEGWEEGFKAATREQDPFIYIREDTEMPFGGYEHCGQHEPGAFPVYTAPPKRDSSSWVGLTDEEIYDYADKFLYQHGSNYGIRSFGKAIEARLKEKNS